jgi:hypothetical protein
LSTYSVDDHETIKTYRLQTGDGQTPDAELLTDLKIMRSLAYAIITGAEEKKQNEQTTSTDI